MKEPRFCFFGPYKFDYVEMVHRAGTRVLLPSKYHYKILAFLIDNSGRECSLSEIRDSVWMENPTTLESVRTRVYELNSWLKGSGALGTDYIRLARKDHFQFIAEVSDQEDPFALASHVILLTDKDDLFTHLNKFRLAEHASCIQMSGQALDEAWFNDRRFRKTIKKRLASKGSGLDDFRVILPSERSEFLKLLMNDRAMSEGEEPDLDFAQRLVTKNQYTQRAVRRVSPRDRETLRVTECYSICSGFLRFDSIGIIKSYRFPNSSGRHPVILVKQEQMPANSEQRLADALFKQAVDSFEMLWEASSRESLLKKALEEDQEP